MSQFETPSMREYTEHQLAGIAAFEPENAAALAHRYHNSNSRQEAVHWGEQIEVNYNRIYYSLGKVSNEQH